jgi:hypothetical protein
MQEIETALLAGYGTVTVSGVEFILKPLKHDTRKAKEREARERANQLVKILNS